MKAKLICAMALACAAFQLAAMPTEEETKQAEPVVKKMLASERAALESGKKTRSEVAAAAMKLADEADTDAAKLLLMKGAFVLYVKDGNLEKAVETMSALEAAISDMPPQSVTNMIEMALKGASKKVDGERLYKLLDETRDAEYKFSYKLENRKAIITGIDPKPVGTVVIPNNIDGHSVTHIGWEAFRNCKELTSVTIPEGVTHIDVHAFDNCIGLKSVILPSSLKDIGYAAFGKCMELKSVTIPNGVRSIASDAFNGSGLKSVVIPESVTRIGDRAFCGCRELGSVTIPAGVAKLGKGVFGGCNALKLINIDSGNQAYTLVDGALYTKDRSVLVMWPNPPMSVAIPVGVASIMDWAFAGGSGMTSVTIPASVTSIGGIAFIGCDGLKSITIPPSVTSIGEHAFDRCVELTEVTMLGERPEAPKNLFPGCRKLKSIHVPASAKSWGGMKEWQGIPLVFDAEAVESRQEQSRYMIVDLDKSGKDAVSYLDDVPNGGWSDKYRTKKIALRRIGPGSFEYLPGKSFKITKPFYIGVFEVTQKQYEMVMNVNPSVFKGDMMPVEKVSYLDIRGMNNGKNWPKDNQVDDDSYLGKLRKRIGLEFDLPTEVQWEYACRAGTKGDFNVDGVEKVKFGKCVDNGGRIDHHVKVGSFLPNAWGLYDMHGNVWEWCLDRGKDGWADFDWKTEPKETETDPKGPAVGSSRIHRGASWDSGAGDYRFSHRGRCSADRRKSDTGFRLACPADGHPMKLSTDKKLHELKTDNGDVGANGKTKTVSSGKETIDGVEWAYSIIDGQALVDYASASNVTGSITIPSTLGGSPVTSVGRNEFRSGFGWRVFEKCCNMTSVAIPSGVMNIGDSAFFGCSNMVSVAIPASVTNIARCAFSRCDSLSSVVVDEENAKYSSRNGMLCSKDGATLIAGVNGDVSIPPCVKNIEDYAFQGRSGLKSVIVPSSVTSVGISAFSDCRGLKSVAIPASVKKIGWYAFSGCSGLMSFSVDPDNPSYSARDGMLCSKDGSTLLAGVNGDVTIPPCVRKIDRHAFDRCSGLRSVAIPDSVTSIGEYAFRWCSGLTSVTIPSSVTDIGFYAFFGCKKLGTVMIPSSVTKIGRGLFSGCDKLMSFSVDPANPSYSSRNGMLCTKDGATLISGVNGDVAIPSSVKNIGDNAFSGCTGLTSVTIPSSVTNIGYQAFDKCEGLTSVTIPSSVKCIGERIFTMCHKIKSVTIPEGVTGIGKYAFAWCKDIESLVIPQDVTSIGEYAFCSCSGLTSVTMCGERPEAPNNIFMRCGKLKSIHVPANAKSWAGMKDWLGIPLVFDAILIL